MKPGRSRGVGGTELDSPPRWRHFLSCEYALRRFVREPLTLEGRPGAEDVAVGCGGLRIENAGVFGFDLALTCVVFDLPFERFPKDSPGT